MWQAENVLYIITNRKNLSANAGSHLGFAMSWRQYK